MLRSDAIMPWITSLVGLIPGRFGFGDYAVSSKYRYALSTGIQSVRGLRLCLVVILNLVARL